jgi:hypothetical protein
VDDRLLVGSEPDVFGIVHAGGARRGAVREEQRRREPGGKNVTKM